MRLRQGDLDNNSGEKSDEMSQNNDDEDESNSKVNGLTEQLRHEIEPERQILQIEEELKG